MHELLIVVASLEVTGLWDARASVAAARGLSSGRFQALKLGLSCCGRAWAYLLHSTWDLPCPGIKPVSPELAGEFFTTEPPGTPIRIP